MTISEIRDFCARVIFAKWLRRGVLAVFFLAVAILLVKEARNVDWDDVVRSVGAYDAATLAIAAALVALSYLIYSAFDLLGRHFIGSTLPARRFMMAAFVSYAFNLSLGAVIGAVAFRIRVYSRMGFDALQVSQLISLSVITNWLGYATVAGIVFASGRISLPAGWNIEQNFLRVAGALILCTAVGYMTMCAWNQRRELKFLKYTVPIPGRGLAALQLLLSTLHWPAEAAVVYVLLHGQLDFVMVLGALSLSAIAAVITHVPAGIGIVETIFVALNGGRMPMAELLAALLVFRALYFLSPLAVAALIYIRAEVVAKNSAAERTPLPS